MKTTFAARKTEHTNIIDKLRRAAARRSREENIPVPLEEHLRRAAAQIWAQSLPFPQLRKALRHIAADQGKEPYLTNAVIYEAINRLHTAPITNTFHSLTN